MQARPGPFRPALPLRVTSRGLGAAGAVVIGADIIIGAGITAAGGAACRDNRFPTDAATGTVRNGTLPHSGRSVNIDGTLSIRG